MCLRFRRVQSGLTTASSLPDLNLIYNDSYAVMANKKHPSLFGSKAAVGWSEIWEGLKGTALAVINDDLPVHKHDDLLFMQRDGGKTPEETHFSWSWVGVKDESGRNGGMLNRAWETTTKVLAERRLLTLRELAQATCESPSESRPQLSLTDRALRRCRQLPATRSRPLPTPSSRRSP